jgi:hypothetical protein
MPWSVAQGGVQLSYQSIEQRMKISPNSIIYTRRMPPGYTVLRNLCSWRREEVDAWVRHILDRQTGVISAERRFAWQSVPQPKGKAEVIVQAFQPVPVDVRCVPWTTSERLYAKLIQEQEGQSERLVNPWGGLPPARSNHIYSPYTMALYQALNELHADDDNMLQLITQVVALERLGPIHVSTLSKRCLGS